MQKWITYTEKGSTTENGGWDAQSPFAGSEYYGGNVANGRAAALKDTRATIFRITGIDKVSALVNATADSRYVILNVYEVTEGNRASTVTATQQINGKTTSVLTIESLSPSTIYDVELTGSNNSNVRAYEIAFYKGQGSSTSITSVNAQSAADSPAYNLSGQKVGKDYKGVVVKNGKKYIIK